MTHSMFMAIISFIAFAAIAGGFGYFIYKRTPIAKDIRDDLGL